MTEPEISTDATTETPAPPSPLQRKMKRAFYALIIAAVLMTVLRFMGPPNITPPADIAATVTQVPEPKTELPMAEPTTQSPAPQAEDTSALHAKIALLEAQLKEKSDAPPPAAGSPAHLKQWQAYASLREMALQGKPFKVELERLFAASAGDETIIEKAAALTTIDRVPTTASLLASFKLAAPNALKYSTAPAQKRWVKNLQRHMSNLLTIRRVENPRADTVDAKLLAIETALESGDDVATLQAITALDEGSKSAMQAVVEQLHTRTSALAALDAIAAHLGKEGA